MNIWEYLGLPSTHRPEDKTVQLVRHHEDVIKKITWPRIAQVKKDGVFAIIIIDQPADRSAIFGRTGRELMSVEHMLPVMKPGSGNTGRVAIIAELCCNHCSLEELSGIVNPNRKKALEPLQQGYIDKAYFAIHDMVYINELIAGVSHRTYEERTRDLQRGLDATIIPGSLIHSDYVEDEQEWEEFAQLCISRGEEGAVSKEPGAGWVAGRKNEVATKRVKGVDYDLRVVGYEEGKGKHAGMVGKLLVQWVPYGVKGTCTGDYQVLPVDGCFTQDMRREWFNDYFGTIHNKIVHVHALCIGSKGALRLPKVKTVRIDKTVADL